MLPTTLAYLRAILTPILGISEELIFPDQLLIEDLGADSLDLIEILIAFEESNDVKIPDILAVECLSTTHIGHLIESWFRLNLDTFEMPDFFVDQMLLDFSTVSSFHLTGGTENAKHVAATENSSESIDEVLLELDYLVGIQEAKDEIKSIINLMSVRRMRINAGINVPDISLHMVFSGNPGTGKTTVARIVGRVFRSIGILKRGHLVEVDRSNLVSGYMGQTAIKCREALESALGGILFIDEAYTLSRSSDQDYGMEAIDTIVKFMEDHRGEIAVIAAGYRNEMFNFIKSNPGLQSRFNKIINFEDYSDSEAYEIFLGLAVKNQYFYTTKTAQIVFDHLSSFRSRRAETFGNGRDVRNAFEAVVHAQSNRIAMSTENFDAAALQTINEDDVHQAFLRLGQNVN